MGFLMKANCGLSIKFYELRVSVTLLLANKSISLPYFAIYFDDGTFLYFCHIITIISICSFRYGSVSKSLIHLIPMANDTWMQQNIHIPQFLSFIFQGKKKHFMHKKSVLHKVNSSSYIYLLIECATTLVGHILCNLSQALSTLHGTCTYLESPCNIGYELQVSVCIMCYIYHKVDFNVIIEKS